MRSKSNYPRRIYGIDFSGARDAGKKIWIAGGEIRTGVLQIKRCQSADFFLNSLADRENCLKALRYFVGSSKGCAIGLDFPFGLPRAIVNTGSWRTFIEEFARNFPTVDNFRAACQAKEPGKELKRKTDERSKTPFSPYNLRLFRQTYYGICDVLRPLVQQGSICVLPMQKAVSGRPCVVEVCPASTLKELYPGHGSYKGKEESRRQWRKRILDKLERTGELLVSRTVRVVAADNRGGDALDSIIAAYATYRNLKKSWQVEGDVGHYGLEGYVFI